MDKKKFNVALVAKQKRTLIERGKTVITVEADNEAEAREAVSEQVQEFQSKHPDCGIVVSVKEEQGQGEGAEVEGKKKKPKNK